MSSQLFGICIFTSFILLYFTCVTFRTELFKECKSPFKAFIPFCFCTDFHELGLLPSRRLRHRALNTNNRFRSEHFKWLFTCIRCCSFRPTVWMPYAFLYPFDFLSEWFKPKNKKPLPELYPIAAFLWFGRR